MPASRPSRVLSGVLSLHIQEAKRPFPSSTHPLLDPSVYGGLPSLFPAQESAERRLPEAREARPRKLKSRRPFLGDPNSRPRAKFQPISDLHGLLLMELRIERSLTVPTARSRPLTGRNPRRQSRR